MKASVIIPTYQGATRIKKTLRALEHQTEKDFEVIIVIDGSADNTKEIIQSSVFELPSIQIIDQANKGRSGARNSGAVAAHSDLLIFYDDDILPAENSVERHIEFYRNNPGSVLIGFTPQKVTHSSNDFNLYRARLSNNWMAAYCDEPMRLTRENLFMTAANFSVDKKKFLQLDGFYEKLKDAEDKEFAIRAFKKDIPLFFHKQNIALHDEQITCRSYILRLRQYHSANQELAAIHPDFMMAKPVRATKRKFYWLVASPLFVSAIDNFNIFRILPGKIRYKVYDAITFALSRIYSEIKI